MYNRIQDSFWKIGKDADGQVAINYVKVAGKMVFDVTVYAYNPDAEPAVGDKVLVSDYVSVDYTRDYKGIIQRIWADDGDDSPSIIIRQAGSYLQSFYPFDGYTWFRVIHGKKIATLSEVSIRDLQDMIAAWGATSIEYDDMGKTHYAE